MAKRKVQFETFNDGVCSLWQLARGKAPVPLQKNIRFRKRTVGERRNFDAEQNGHTIQMLIRVPRMDFVKTGTFVTIGARQFNETQADFSDKTAEMAERVAPVVNEVKEGVNELVDVLLEATEGADYEGMASGVSAGFGILKDIVKFLVDNGSTVTGIIVAIVGGLVALKGISFVSKITGALKGVTTLTGAMSGLVEVFPALSGAFSFLSNPIGIAVAAIGAIIAAVIYLWNTNEDFRDAVIAIWEGIKTAASDFCKGIAEKWDNLKDGAKDIASAIGSAWSDAMEGIKTAASVGMDALSNAAGGSTVYIGKEV